MSELVYTPVQLADELGVCIETIRRLTAEGRVPHVRLSAQRVVYPKAQIEQWLADEARAMTILAEIESDAGGRRGVA